MKRVVLVRPRRPYKQKPLVGNSDAFKKSGQGDGGNIPPKGGIYISTPNPGTAGAGKDTKPPALDKVVELAGQLTAQERKQLLATLALSANAADAGKIRDVDMWTQAVYDDLQGAGGLGSSGVQGPMVVKRALTAPSAWGAVSEFMRISKLESLKVTERQSIYGLLAKLVVDDAIQVTRKTGTPMSARLVGNCSTRVAGLFDNAFPGYLASGLALIVAKRLTEPELVD